MILTAKEKCLLWLSSAEVTPARVTELSEYYHGAEGIWEAFGRHGGPSFQPGAEKALRRLHTPAALDDLLEALEKKNVRLLFADDARYPEQLRAIQDPPYLLYYAGRLGCLEHPMVGLVGARRASAYGCEMARMLAHGLAQAGVCVVSGLARGIDAAAHQGALDAGGRTVGVLGSGINVPYPPEHTPMLRKIAGGIGLVLSEYPLDAGPLPFHFPHRNRIISGLSRGVVFVEGRIKSGGMHTVSAALAQGREVFAVPGRVGFAGTEGPHTILREGARIVTSAADLLDDLGLAPPAGQRQTKATSALSQPQRRIAAALSIEPLNAQELAKRLEMQDSDVLCELSLMEIMGVIRREAGSRYSLPLPMDE